MKVFANLMSWLFLAMTWLAIAFVLMFAISTYAHANDEYYWKVRGSKMTSPHYQIDCKVPRKMAAGNTRHRFEMTIKRDQSSKIDLGPDIFRYMGVWRDDDKVGRSAGLSDHLTTNSSSRFVSTSSAHPTFVHDWIKYITGGDELIIRVRGSQQSRWTHFATIRSPSKDASSQFLANCRMPNLDAPAGKSLGAASKVDGIYEDETSRPAPDPSANGGIGVELGWSKFGKYAISNHWGKVSSTNSWFISCQDNPQFRQTISVKRNDIRGKYMNAFQQLEMRITTGLIIHNLFGKVNSRPGYGYTPDDVMVVISDNHVAQLKPMLETMTSGDAIKLEYKLDGRWHLFHKASSIPMDVANDLLIRCGINRMQSTAPAPTPKPSVPKAPAPVPSVGGGTDDAYDPLEDTNIILTAPPEPPAPPVIIRTKVNTIQEKWSIDIPTITKQSLESNLHYILNDTCKYVTQSPAFIDANQELAMQCAQLYLMIKNQ